MTPENGGIAPTMPKYSEHDALFRIIPQKWGEKVYE